jgi:transcriptional regulator with XRE-family HTH domain
MSGLTVTGHYDRKTIISRANMSIEKLSIRQVKAARELLAWSQGTLAKRSGVGVSTVMRLEAKDGVLGGREETGKKIRAALESAGVEFTNGDTPGVKLRKRPIGDPSASIPVEDLNASNNE